jgi:hypothetical protein
MDCSVHRKRIIYFYNDCFVPHTSHSSWRSISTFYGILRADLIVIFFDSTPLRLVNISNYGSHCRENTYACQLCGPQLNAS